MWIASSLRPFWTALASLARPWRSCTMSMACRRLRSLKSWDHKANGLQPIAQARANRSGLARRRPTRWGNDEEGGKRMRDCVSHLELLRWRQARG